MTIDGNTWTLETYERIEEWLVEKGLHEKTADFSKLCKAVARCLADGTLPMEIAKQIETETTQVPSGAGAETMTTKAVPEKVFSGNPRVKAPSEAYSSKRWSAKHAKHDRAVFDEMGTEVTKPSQLSLAKAGAFLKHSARKAGLSVDWTEHDAAIFRETVEKDDWASFAGPEHENRIYGGGAVKALLDDNTSGGLEVAPIEFDADIITVPLLNNELLPLVDLKPVSRGRRIEGASMLRPTANWGGGDGTSITPFSTAAMVAAIDTTIFTIDVAIEVGRDFLSDSPVNVGSLLTELIGGRLANELDSVIADGNGTTQPQGVMQASGTTGVAFSSAAVTITKLLSLLFGVGKAYRAPAGNNFAFVSNETGYQRARAVATGVSGDTRLVLGMDVESYSALQRPWRIANTLSNVECFAGAMSKYRLYRRLGLSVEWVTGGRTLALSNQALLVVRARYGGKVMDGGAFAVVTDAQA